MNKKTNFDSDRVDHKIWTCAGESLTPPAIISQERGLLTKHRIHTASNMTTATASHGEAAGGVQSLDDTICASFTTTPTSREAHVEDEALATIVTNVTSSSHALRPVEEGGTEEASGENQNGERNRISPTLSPSLKRKRELISSLSCICHLGGCSMDHSMIECG
jgi:hypothetical protein